jgi:hypothetical protein
MRVCREVEQHARSHRGVADVAIDSATHSRHHDDAAAAKQQRSEHDNLLMARN